MPPRSENGTPLYNRKGRSRPSHRGSLRGSGRLGLVWWICLVSPLVLAVFFLGVFLGSGFSRFPREGGGYPSPSGFQEVEGRSHGNLRLGTQEEFASLGTTKSDGPVEKPNNLRLPGPLQLEGIHNGEKATDRGSSVADGRVGDIFDRHRSFKARQGVYVSLESSLDQYEEALNGATLGILVEDERHNTSAVHDQVTAAAWIYIDPKRYDSNINTIMGNKMSGCDSDSIGFSLYINQWEEKDGRLWLEWGDGRNGCRKISSPDVIPKGLWIHVGASLDIQGASLFIDGQKVAHSEWRRQPGSRENFYVGAFPSEDFPFSGNISAVTVFKSGLKDHDMEALQQVTSRNHLNKAILSNEIQDISKDMVVALQLDESAGGEKNGMTAEDSIGLGLGTYSFRYEVVGYDTDLRDGLTNTQVTTEMREESDRIGRERAAKVKAAMQHVWTNYRQYAWGWDELAPRTKKGKNPWGSMGVTLVDSLDTLWLMGMKDEFWEARDWVRDKLTFDKANSVSVFETTIRELGGLLSAYDLSGDKTFLTKAQMLGDKLLPAFNTNSGLPTSHVNFKSGTARRSQSVLAEIGTLQVEFRYLSHATGDPKYANKVNHVFEHLAQIGGNHGLYPIYFSPTNGRSTTTQVTLGALGDSFYEYLLKVWLQGGKTESTYRDMYDRAMDGVAEVLIKKSNPSGMTFVSDWNGSRNINKMDHLVCFLAGSLALGSTTHEDPEKAERDLRLAKALAFTCYNMYSRQKTGLAPEMVNFRDGQDMVVPGNAGYYKLRPETAESLFILHQITGDPIYREWSWSIFQAIEKHCKTPNGYGSHPDVNNPSARAEDNLESFFLAETLKYLFLIQDPDHIVDLTKVVFNTEAHPLRIFSET